MKLNLERKLNADDKLANEGVDFYISGDISIKLKSAGPRNTKLKWSIEQFYRKHNLDGSKEMPSKLLDEWMRMFADAIVVSWEGVKDDDTGKKVKCTPDNVLLAFKQTDGLFNMCIEFAQDVSNYPQDEPTKEEMEEQAKS